MVFDWLLRRNTLYYPGCLTHVVFKNIEKNYETILKKTGTNYIMMPDLVCCGSPAKNAGYEKDAEKLCQKNIQNFDQHGVKTIITNCPACAQVLKTYRHKKIKIRHISEIILENMHKLSFKKQKGTVTYHDPCHLGRYMQIYEEPREIIKKLGYKLVEMRDNRENALCCGGGGGLASNHPKTTQKAKDKRIQQAVETKADMLITSCPLCYAVLKENKKIVVKELSQVLTDALK